MLFDPHTFLHKYTIVITLLSQVLGNEIRYGDFHSLDIDSMKENMNFLNWLITMAQNQEYEINNNLM